MPRTRRWTWAHVMEIDRAMDVVASECGLWPWAALFLRRLERRRRRLVAVLVRRDRRAAAPEAR